MNEAIIGNYQSVVTDDDHVYFIGDIVWNYQTLPGLLQRLPGNKHLIVGNHDKCFKEVYALHNTMGYELQKLESLSRKYIDFYLNAGFETVLANKEIDISGQSVWLSHFPYKSPQKPTDYIDRYWDMRLEDHGNWLIHGHRHDKAPFFDGKHSFNVSVEVTNYKPVSEYEIAKVITQQIREPIQVLP
jgi:calcineurin-like phosphoesterase family protein